MTVAHALALLLAAFIGGMLNDFLFDKGWIGKTFLEGGAFVRSSASEGILRPHSTLERCSRLRD